MLAYLGGPKWDGALRLDKWLTTYFGAADTPLNNALGRKTLIAAVRRLRQPGVKFDQMLVLEGTQGAGKSRALRALAGDNWFSDNLEIGADTKRIMEIAAGKWIIEVPELSGMNRRDVEHVKAMLSRQVDEARLSYDRKTTKAPRQFILIGTTNASAYLHDDTGGRRFWPVRSPIPSMSRGWNAIATSFGPRPSSRKPPTRRCTCPTNCVHTPKKRRQPAA